MNQTVPGGRAIDICASIREMGEWGRNVSFLVVAKNQKEMEKCRAESNINADDWITEPLSAAYIRTRIRMSLLRSPCRWKRAPIPINEDARLAALYDSCMLDVDHSDSLTRIGRIATQLFDCAAFCSLLDKDRVKFISGEGMKCQDVPRDAAMCAHVVHNNDILVVNDALEDDRFADNPLVKGAPFLRFYAGTG